MPKPISKVIPAWFSCMNLGLALERETEKENPEAGTPLKDALKPLTEGILEAPDNAK